MSAIDEMIFLYSHSGLFFLNIFASYFFSNFGTLLPSSPSWISCPNPSIPQLNKNTLS